MLPRFFIDRPIFAWVIAIVIMLAGLAAILNLPIQQYPAIAEPQIGISATYPGASAKTIEDSVTQIIEQKMKGLDGLKYMSASSDASGSASIVLTFRTGTNIDIAQVQVQNKLQTAVPLLPQEVQAQGLYVQKTARNYLLACSIYSDDPNVATTDIADYLASHVIDPISRIPGVGETISFGTQHAMRIWLDPAKLAALNLVPADAVAAIRAQNTQVTAGQIGGLPASGGVGLNATITAQSRLQTAAQFRRIVVKTSPAGAAVTLGDIARVEIGAESYDFTAQYLGHPSSGFAIRLAPGANALETAESVKAKFDQLALDLPAGYHAVVPFDSTPFVRLSIREVVKTLIEAIGLVFLVMFLFLQSWRATIIPTIAVPVVLLGTFGVLAACGYTINTLTMFALVLAIGLLVDDAIVVVENVERVMREEKLSAIEATRRSMDQITSALIGVALVLSAVFIPMGFFGGSQGVIYRQFSLTIVAAMGLSVLVALILTPALCATLLNPSAAHADGAERTGPLAAFDRGFERLADRYRLTVQRILGQGTRWMAIYAAILVAIGLLFLKIPGSFLPDEDQGSIMVSVQLPPGTTQVHTLQTLEEVRRYFMDEEKDGLKSLFTITGYGFAGVGQNSGMAFVRLKDFELRRDPRLKAQAIAGRAMQHFATLRNASVYALVPPPVMELGSATGFDLELLDTGGIGHERLMAARNQLLGMASQQKALVGVRPNGQDDTAQLKLDIDPGKVGSLGLTVADINAALASAWGGTYVNDFIDRGRVKKVYLQGDAAYRGTPDDLSRWFVRNNAGQMVPFSAFSTATWTKGSPRLERYNGSPSLDIQGAAAPGRSTGEAMAIMAKLVSQLPAGVGYQWTGVSLQEQESGAKAPLLYGLSILVVFLMLAALYESWTIPFAVILVVPLGVIGALLATQLRGLNNDIYFQIGLLTTMGLAAKNAILIVEFATTLHRAGQSLTAAALEAVRIRLRPIVMTSLAFGCGVVPLAIATGAGSGAQRAIGNAVVGGMLTATGLAIFFVPLLFVLVESGVARWRRRGTP
jgi:multidrug efflux pump